MLSCRNSGFSLTCFLCFSWVSLASARSADFSFCSDHWLLASCSLVMCFYELDCDMVKQNFHLASGLDSWLFLSFQFLFAVLFNKTSFLFLLSSSFWFSPLPDVYTVLNSRLEAAMIRPYLDGSQQPHFWSDAL